jgi:hypothetical protein
MMALRKAALPFEKIAAALNAGGLRPRTGERWYPGVVRRILLAQAKQTANVENALTEKARRSFLSPKLPKTASALIAG